MARTITVDDDGPADYSSIKEAVEAASEGDTVLVRAGSYHEYGIVMKNGLVLQGAGADSTTIWAAFREGPGGWPNNALVVFDSVTTGRIDGFTLTYPGCAAIAGINSSPTITRNKIIDSFDGIWLAYYPGYGDIAEQLAPINGNTITGNGAGIIIYPQHWSLGPVNLDITQNWWGTTTESEIAAGIFDGRIAWPDFVTTYDPWLSEPVDSFTEQPGIHYNNIYANIDVLHGIEMNFILSLPVAALPVSWGEVKDRYR